MTAFPGVELPPAQPLVFEAGETPAMAVIVTGSDYYGFLEIARSATEDAGFVDPWVHTDKQPEAAAFRENFEIHMRFDVGEREVDGGTLLLSLATLMIAPLVETFPLSIEARLHDSHGDFLGAYWAENSVREVSGAIIIPVWLLRAIGGNRPWDDTRDIIAGMVLTIYHQIDRDGLLPTQGRDEPVDRRRPDEPG
jgi:hypothetical protein